MNETNLYSSIKVLLSLQVMINQDFESLIYYSKNLSNDVLSDKTLSIPPKENYLDTTIIDALRFSIVLKSCSFIDEWDGFLGVKNEKDQNQRIEVIKRAMSKARRTLKKWKDLRTCRNEIIAHNFRDRNNKVTIDMMGSYNCPRTIPELYFLVSIIERMTKVLTICFWDITNEIVQDFSQLLEKGISNKFDLNFEKVESKLQEIDEEISENVFDIYCFDLINTMIKNIETNN